jgi:hypothetical protein
MKTLNLLFFALLFVLTSCNDAVKNKDETGNEEAPQENGSESPEISETYRSDTWHFSIQYPTGFTALESELPGSAPVVNIYEKNESLDPPFGFHEEPESFYISFVPEGFGTETPAGKQQSFSKWRGSLPLGFDIDKESSVVFMLDDGTPWAYMLKFRNPPMSWGSYGTIFMQLPISDFTAECRNASGEVKPMSQCDPLGSDKVSYFGTIAPEDANLLNNILRSLEFHKGSEDKKQLSELIRIEHPLPNSDIRSPLQIKGKAKGYWFFEGSFPVRLEDGSGNTLFSGSIQTQGNWMTEEFVNFEKEITFSAPDDERGYLIFNRANASGLQENDRTYRMPVLFPPYK